MVPPQVESNVACGSDGRSFHSWPHRWIVSIESVNIARQVGIQISAFGFFAKIRFGKRNVVLQSFLRIAGDLLRKMRLNDPLFSRKPLSGHKPWQSRITVGGILIDCFFEAVLENLKSR